MTIREAALALGTSELTIRRRIKDGRLSSRLEAGKYFVRLGEEPSPTAVPRTSTPSAPEGDAPTPAIDMRTVLEQQARLAEAAGRAGLLEEQLRDLQDRYVALHEGTVALASRNGWLESKLEERDREIKLLADSRRSVSWWRRLFHGA